MNQKFFCPKCGSTQDPEAKFCQNCGAQMKGQTQQEQTITPQPITVAPVQSVSQVVQVTVPGTQPSISQKSRLVALILCLLFGVIGVHRFYVGKVGSGILYLFTFGICGIGWAIDCLVILLGGFKDGTHQMVTKW